MPPGEIRRAADDDQAAALALWTEAYVTLSVDGRTEPFTGSDFLGPMRNGEVFVIDGDAGLSGVVVLLAPGAAGRVVADGDEAELARIAVAAAVRGRGLGRALVAHCEQRARAAGWSAIALWSRTRQVEAHRLYESTGYVRVPGRDWIDATGQTRLVFRLELE